MWEEQAWAGCAGHRGAGGVSTHTAHSHARTCTDSHRCACRLVPHTRAHRCKCSLSPVEQSPSEQWDPPRKSRYSCAHTCTRPLRCRPVITPTSLSGLASRTRTPSHAPLPGPSLFDPFPHLPGELSQGPLSCCVSQGGARRSPCPHTLSIGPGPAEGPANRKPALPGLPHIRWAPADSQARPQNLFPI